MEAIYNLTEGTLAMLLSLPANAHVSPGGVAEILGVVAEMWGTTVGTLAAPRSGAAMSKEEASANRRRLTGR